MEQVQIETTSRSGTGKAIQCTGSYLLLFKKS